MLKKLLKNNRTGRTEAVHHEAVPERRNDTTALTLSLEENIRNLVEWFGGSSDLIIRRIEANGLRAALIYFNTLVDKAIADAYVAKPLQLELENYAADDSGQPLDISSFKLTTNNVCVFDSCRETAGQLLQGNTVVLFDNCAQSLGCDTSGGERRSVAEASRENVVRGPREAFNESLQTGLGLVRRRLNTPKLRIEKMTVGAVSGTSVALLHIEGIAKSEIVKEVRSKLQSIHIDGVLESMYIEEMIEDRDYTPFPTVFSTERPDRVAACLLEGRIAIMVDGTPDALVIPATVSLFLYSNEDYYQRYDIATLLKLLRTFTFIISIFVPGFYVALLIFHQEMLPTPLLIALTGQREGVPFGAALEITFMEITFEILREAGIRLPKAIGTAISIVGGLVLGQAAVEAGLVAPGTIITVALTAIASFCTPSYNIAITARMLRFLVLVMSAVLGAFGFFFAVILIVTHLNTLRSFGVPYLSPIVPFQKRGWKDIFIRVPWPKMRTRPEETSGQNKIRIGEK